MTGDRVFFDTNVLVYAFAKDDFRSNIAANLLSHGGVIGVQVLNEFVNVATRKLGMNWAEVREALAAVRALCPRPAPLTIETHEKALGLARRLRYSFYDSLVIAAALCSACTALYSEDMRDGQVIEGLTIRNPFRGHAPASVS